MLELMQRHELELLNADAMCTGTITRYRVTQKLTDSVLVCKQLHQFFVKMVINEERMYTLTKYGTTKGSKKKFQVIIIQ